MAKSKADKSFLQGGKVPGLSSKGGHSKAQSFHFKATKTPSIKPGKGFKSFSPFKGFPSAKHRKF